MKFSISRTAQASMALLMFAANQSIASPRDALEVFDGLCVGTGGNIKAIEKMALASGGKPVPPSILNQDAAIAQYGGKAWAITRGNSVFAVAVSSLGDCTIFSRDEEPVEVIKLIEANYPLSKPVIETAGPQIARLYKITQASVYVGSYVTVVVPKPEFRNPMMPKAMFIGYVTPAAKAKLDSQNK